MVSKIDTYTSDSLPYHRNETSEKALSVRVRCLETCHAVRNLLHKCPEFRFDCLDFAYAGMAGKPSLAGQTFAARGGKGGAREGGKRTSGHYRQVSVA